MEKDLSARVKEERKFQSCRYLKNGSDNSIRRRTYLLTTETTESTYKTKYVAGMLD